MKRFALGAALSVMTALPSFADTTVTYLNISTGSDKDLMVAVAKEYEAAHPGIKIELPTLENEAFKAKLTTVMQSALEASNTCRDLCLVTLAHCLEKGGPLADARHVETLIDCSTICATMGTFLARGSERHAALCTLTAQICRGFQR